MVHPYAYIHACTYLQAHVPDLSTSKTKADPHTCVCNGCASFRCFQKCLQISAFRCLCCTFVSVFLSCRSILSACLYVCRCHYITASSERDPRSREFQTSTCWRWICVCPLFSLFGFMLHWYKLLKNRCFRFVSQRTDIWFSIHISCSVGPHDPLHNRRPICLNVTITS